MRCAWTYSASSSSSTFSTRDQTAESPPPPISASMRSARSSLAISVRTRRASAEPPARSDCSGSLAAARNSSATASSNCGDTVLSSEKALAKLRSSSSDISSTISAAASALKDASTIAALCAFVNHVSNWVWARPSALGARRSIFCKAPAITNTLSPARQRQPPSHWSEQKTPP